MHCARLLAVTSDRLHSACGLFPVSLRLGMLFCLQLAVPLFVHGSWGPVPGCFSFASMQGSCAEGSCCDSSSSSHTADSSRTSHQSSLPFCHFFVDSSRLVYFSGAFRQFLARCTAVLPRNLMLCLSLLDLVELTTPPWLWYT